jgi:hypothetical protein
MNSYFIGLALKIVVLYFKFNLLLPLIFSLITYHFSVLMLISVKYELTKHIQLHRCK